MRRRELGRTGVKVTELALGTMTWGNQTTEAEGHAQIDMALDHGVNLIDTAEAYPVNPVLAETAGRTESILGSWFAASGRRHEVVLATKIAGAGSPVRGGAPVTSETLREALEGSLRRLRTEYVDLYQVHWPNRGSYHFRRNWGYDPSGQDRAETVAHMEDVLEAMQRLVRAGKVRHFGVSNETVWGVAQWLRIAEARGWPRLVSVQNEYSLLCRAADTDMAELLANEGLGLLAYSPLAGGLLSGKYAGDVTPDGSRRSFAPDLGGRISPRVWQAVSAYLGIAADHGLDPCQMALAFARSRPFVTAALVGATSTVQLQNALGAAGLDLGPEVLADIEAAHRAYPLPF